MVLKTWSSRKTWAKKRIDGVLRTWLTRKVSSSRYGGQMDMVKSMWTSRRGRMDMVEACGVAVW